MGQQSLIPIEFADTTEAMSQQVMEPVTLAESVLAESPMATRTDFNPFFEQS